MTDGDGRTWTIEGRETLHEGFYRVERLRFRHTRHDGGTTGTIEREFLRRGNVVGVLPWDPASDRVVLVEQFRHGALGQPEGPWLWEIVAGMIDPGETPAEVARREAREEAGLDIGALEPIAHYLASPGMSDEEVFLYAAETDLSSVEGGLFGLEHEGEDIRMAVVDAGRAIGMMGTREVRNALSIIALQWLERRRSRRAEEREERARPSERRESRPRA